MTTSSPYLAPSPSLSELILHRTLAQYLMAMTTEEYTPPPAGDEDEITSLILDYDERVATLLDAVTSSPVSHERSAEGLRRFVHGILVTMIHAVPHQSEEFTLALERASDVYTGLVKLAA